jgi:hypothetical protein
MLTWLHTAWFWAWDWYINHGVPGNLAASGILFVGATLLIERVWRKHLKPHLELHKAHMLKMDAHIKKMDVHIQRTKEIHEALGVGRKADGGVGLDAQDDEDDNRGGDQS